MIPQDTFIIVAKIDTVQLDKLRALLKTMTFTDRTGMADPDNPLVRFGDFDTIHFARFVVLAHNTLKARDAPFLAHSQLVAFVASIRGGGSLSRIVSNHHDRAARHRLGAVCRRVA